MFLKFAATDATLKSPYPFVRTSEESSLSILYPVYIELVVRLLMVLNWKSSYFESRLTSLQSPKTSPEYLESTVRFSPFPELNLEYLMVRLRFLVASIFALL